MKRRVFNIAAAMSLVLCVAISIQWVRGHFREGIIGWTKDAWVDQSRCRFTRFAICNSNDGRLAVYLSQDDIDFSYTGDNELFQGGMDAATFRIFGQFQKGMDPAPFRAQRPGETKFVWKYKTSGDLWRGGWCGFSAGDGISRHGPDTNTFTGVAMPFWFLAIVTAIPPALWLRSYRRYALQRFRITHGLCSICGYDLRATPDRCPECGSIPEERCSLCCKA